MSQVICYLGYFIVGHLHERVFWLSRFIVIGETRAALLATERIINLEIVGKPHQTAPATRTRPYMGSYGAAQTFVFSPFRLQ
jgi:hypothetical protein